MALCLAAVASFAQGVQAAKAARAPLTAVATPLGQTGLVANLPAELPLEVETPPAAGIYHGMHAATARGMAIELWVAELGADETPGRALLEGLGEALVGTNQKAGFALSSKVVGEGPGAELVMIGQTGALHKELRCGFVGRQLLRIDVLFADVEGPAVGLAERIMASARPASAPVAAR